jgi:hypothetical protein
MDARQIIDYAANEQGAEMRAALYANIADKVSAHIEAKKQEIAQSLIAQPQESQEQVQDTSIENA